MNNFLNKCMIVPMITLMILTSTVFGVNLLSNGSFETPSLPGGGSTPEVSPWTVSAVYWYMYDQASLGSPVADGLQTLYLFGGTCRQNVGVFQANTVYELTFAIRVNTEADINFGWVALDDGADGNFESNSVGGKILNFDSSVIESAGQFYYGSLILDTADPAYAGLVGHALNVVLYSGGMLCFDDVTLTPYASAGTYLLTNGGFENPVVPAGGGNPVIPGWTISGQVFYVLFDAASLAAFTPSVAEGNQALYLFGGTAVSEEFAVVQADQTYTVTFSAAINPGMTAWSSEVVLVDLDLGGARLVAINLGSVIIGDVANRWFNGSVTYNGATYAHVVGHRIAVQVNSGTQLLIDGVNVKSLPCDPSLGASPVSGSTISFDFDSIGNVPLSWTLPAPTGVDPVSCDVYFGKDPDHMTKVIANQVVNSYTANVSGAGTYYWRIDVIDPAISPMPIRGIPMSFDVELIFPLGDGVNRLTNGSFETPSLPGGGENPSISPWVVSAVYSCMFDQAILGAPIADGLQALYLYGGTCQQNVGAIQANTGYSLDLYVRANDLVSAGYSYAELLAVGTGDPVRLAMVNLGDVISTPFQWTKVALSFDSATNPSVVGKNLVVNLYSGGVVLFDGVNLVEFPSLGASPSKYIAMDVPGNATLSWTLPASTSCDVYLGTDPLTMTKVVNNQSLSSYATSFAAYGKYYWIIGIKNPAVNGGNPAYGPVMNFDVIDRCEGAKRLSGFTPLTGDFNADCEVDMLDLASLASVWVGN